jgi:hypothetical protein
MRRHLWDTLGCLAAVILLLSLMGLAIWFGGCC